MFAFSAVSVGKLKEMQNGGKKTRRGMDVWDRVRLRACSHKPTLANPPAAKYDTPSPQAWHVMT